MKTEDHGEVVVPTSNQQLALLKLLGIRKATVLTLTTICFNGRLSQLPFVTFSSLEEMQPLVSGLLDAGLTVDTYWEKIDYTRIDNRLPKGHRR